MDSNRRENALAVAIVIVGGALLAACTSDAEESGPQEPTDDTFGQALEMSGSARYLPPDDVDEVVEQQATVASGEVIALVEGRRRVLADGSDPELYAQYYEIVIRPDQIIKGEGSTNVDVHVEFVWPRNKATDNLSASLPRGSRAIVLGDRPDGASPTPYTLVQVPPYGLVFETPSGETQLPFEADREFHDVLGQSEPMSFEETLAAIVNAAAP